MRIMYGRPTPANFKSFKNSRMEKQLKVITSPCNADLVVAGAKAEDLYCCNRKYKYKKFLKIFKRKTEAILTFQRRATKEELIEWGME